MLQASSKSQKLLMRYEADPLIIFRRKRQRGSAAEEESGRASWRGP